MKIDPEIKSTYNFSDLRIIPSKGDSQNVHKVPSKNDLLNAIEFEILNNLDFYGRFLEAHKDRVKELNDYRSMRKCSIATNDLVLIALTNYLQFCILLLKTNQARRLYYLQYSDHCINPNHFNAAPKFTLKLKWSREHDETLVDQEGGTFAFYFFIASIIFRFQGKRANKTLNLKCFVSGETLSYKYIKST